MFNYGLSFEQRYAIFIEFIKKATCNDLTIQPLENWSLTEDQTQDLLIQLQYASEKTFYSETKLSLPSFLNQLFCLHPLYANSITLAKCALQRHIDSYYSFSAEVRSSPEIIAYLVARNHLIRKDYLQDTEILLRAIEINPMVYTELPEEQRNKRSLASKAILNLALHPQGNMLFSFLPEKYKQEWGFINTAIIQRWDVYEYLPDNWKKQLKIQCLTVQSFFDNLCLSFDKLVETLSDEFWTTSEAFSLMLKGIDENSNNIIFYDYQILSGLLRWIDKSKENSYLACFIKDVKIEETLCCLDNENANLVKESVENLFNGLDKKYEAFIMYKQLDYALKEKQQSLSKKTKV